MKKVSEEIELKLSENRLVYVKGELKRNIEKIVKTKKGYEIRYDRNETGYNYKNNEVLIKEKMSWGESFESKLNYFTSIARCKDELGKEGATFYSKQIGKLENADEESALISYFNAENKRRELAERLLFPFSLNSSQMRAVKVSFQNQVSMIQGPPGTGKTQTILNLIANAVTNNKSVAIVSPNNEATNNVFSKLENNGFGFIGAQLGKAANRKAFYTDIPEIPKELDMWGLDEDSKIDIERELAENQEKIRFLLEEKNRLAKLKNELREWKTEQKYFLNYLNEKDTASNEIKLKKLRFVNFDINKKKSFFIDTLSENISSIKFLKKGKYFFKYGIYQFKQFETIENQIDIIRSVEADYYKDKINILNAQIKDIDTFLENNLYEKLLSDIENQSLSLFKHALFSRYSENKERDFKENAHKSCSKEFMMQFPVVLSTCDSILECIAEGSLFDYVIIDEASMASLVPSIFPLSVARNIIVVGDEKQLPHIPLDRRLIDDREISEIPSAYNYFEQNLLSSLRAVYLEQLPITLLKEHYRCHPIIINFCNKQYYDDELVIMSSDSTIKNPLVLVKTAKGNHMKIDYDNKFFNQREIDSFLDSEFMEMVPEMKKVESLGFVTPYRKQVEKANKPVGEKYEQAVVDTVHKFQGKECEAILFSTVLDKKAGRQIDFVDNPSLVNVAISRAKKIFILNTSEEKFLENNQGIADLIRYINYYGEYSIKYQSSVRSIFDLLQKDFFEELELKKAKMLKKHSKFDSENLTMDLINRILTEDKYKHITCNTEYWLVKLIRQVDNLSLDEKQYITNGARLDFVFHYKSGKDPVAAIEVDGHKWHRWPAQKVKDNMKDSILSKYGIKIKRLSTNGSNEEQHIRKLLDAICEG